MKTVKENSAPKTQKPPKARKPRNICMPISVHEPLALALQIIADEQQGTEPGQGNRSLAVRVALCAYYKLRQ